MRVQGRYVFLMSVLLAAAALRLAVAVQLPPMLDELKLIEETRSFSWSSLPVHFYGFGWGENIVLALIARPLEGLFGGGLIAMFRGLVLIANLVSLVLLYALAKRFFGERVATVSLLFGAIWPWNILAGSVGFNVFFTFPMLLGALLLLMDAIERERPKRMYIAAFLLAITCYAYEVAFAWSVLIALILLLQYRRRVPKVPAVRSAALFGILVLPIMLFHAQLHLDIRIVDKFLFFTYPQLSATRYEGIGITNIYQGWSLLGHYLLNYVTHFIFLFLSFSPFYYLVTGTIVWAVLTSGVTFVADPAFYFYTPGNGMYYSSLANLWDVVFISIGFVVLLRQVRRLVYGRMLVWWLVLYPIVPSFINADYVGYTVTRDLVGMPLLIILSAVGAVRVFDGLVAGMNRMKAAASTGRRNSEARG